MQLTTDERDQLQKVLEDSSKVTADKIVTIVEQIVAKVHPLQVIAFGSRARGDHHGESDLDLAVVIAGYDAKKERWPISSADLAPSMPIDLLVFGQERYEFMKDSIISVEHDVWNEGVTLYDASVGRIDCGAAARLAA